MKKLLLSLLFLTINSISNAQEILYLQDFTSTTSMSTLTLINADGDTGTAANWARASLSGNPITVSYSAYNSAPLTPDNYLFTPAINLTNVTGNLKLSWKHITPSTTLDAEKYTVYVTTAATTAAALASTPVHVVTTMNNINSLPMQEVSVDLSAYVGQTIHVCFRHHGVTNQSYIVIDDITVSKIHSTDAVLQSISTSGILTPGSHNVTGVIKNGGSTAITSFNLNYSLNGGALVTQSYTGVNILPNATLNFTHNVPFTTVSGLNYNLAVSVTNANDTYVANNTLTKTLQVPSGSTTFKPLIEKFTSSTCAPCASYNNTTFNPFYTAQNQNFNYVAYQMSWPSPGDIYYSVTDGLPRRTYYGVNSITSLWINGSVYATSNNQATLTTHVSNEAAKPSYFVLNAGRDIANNTATVNYNITPYVSGSYTLQAAVIEKTTVNNTGSNGETSFKHVMMKMVPNATGTTITATAGTTITGQITASLAGTFIEDVNDLEVIVFIQDNTTKQIMQSTTAQVGLLGTENFDKKSIYVYPNPASNVLYIGAEELVNVNILDLSGKTLIKTEKVNKDNSINIETLAPGIYMVNISNQNINKTVKLIKK